MHLCISILLVSSALAVIILLWYPAPYFEAMGVGKILLILAVVDVTIGPLITLIIFNPVKKTLKCDLTFIAMLQVLAMIYGIHTVYAGRPVYVVYCINMFTLVSAADILPVDLHKAKDLSLPVTGPRIVAARLPTDPKERERIMFSSVQGGSDVQQMPQHYLPYEAVAAEVKMKMLPFDLLMKYQSKVKMSEAQTLIVGVISKKGLQMTDVGFVPMRGKAKNLTVMVRRSDASIVDILPVNPWGS